MERLERVDIPDEAKLAEWDGFQSGMWTALPCIIESFDATAMTVVAQPALKGKFQNQDGTWALVNMPLLLDCPAQFPAGGGHTLTFPVKQGDECLVVFASRCIDSWWQSGGIQVPAEHRMHDLSDGFALLGFRSKPRVLSAISLVSTQLRSDDGLTLVDVDGAAKTIALTAPTSVTLTTPTVHCTADMQIDGNLTVTNTITATNGNITATNGNMVAGTIDMKNHYHSLVQPGTGNSGGPVG